MSYIVIENFYVEAVRVTSLNDVPNSSLLLRGIASLPRGATFVWKSGATIREAVWTDGGDLLVSWALRKSLSGLTGWKSHAVQVRNKDGSRVVGYHLLSVTGRTGRWLAECSKRIEIPKKDGVQIAFRGLSFADDVDFTDFRLPSCNVDFMVASSAAAKALADNCPNVKIIKCEDFEMNEMVHEAIAEKCGGCDR